MCLTPRCWSQSEASVDTDSGSQPERSKAGAVPNKMRQKLADHWQKEKVNFLPIMAFGQPAAARNPEGQQGCRYLGREEQMLTEQDAGEEVNSPVLPSAYALGALGDRGVWC